MARSVRRPVEEFAAMLHAISQQKDLVILVGGQAVNAWALIYHDRLHKFLAPLQPYTSGDIDVFATRNSLLGLHHELGGKLLLNGPREITDGTLILGVAPDTRELDVLRSVHGLPKIGSHSAMPLEVCGCRIQVLFPHLLLKAKMENALRLDQRLRQDIKHVQIMALVVREFLTEVITTATPENEKIALKMLQEVQQILTSKSAKEFTKLHGLTTDFIMPADLLADSGLRRLVNFGKHLLAATG